MWRIFDRTPFEEGVAAERASSEDVLRLLDYPASFDLRERFGIEPQKIAIASRMIREAVDAGFIAPDDPDAAPKMMRYVPVWAVVGAGRG